MSQKFDRQVAAKRSKLAANTLHDLERQTAAKRLAWARENPPTHPATPRGAFEWLFFDYMRLDPEDVPVVRESADEIVWRSVNPCDTLRACQEMGLDTRRVCRTVYERSTQVLLSQLDPRLRFLRSYRTIRPHADYCLEMIVQLDFEQLMRLALQADGALSTRGRWVISRAQDVNKAIEQAILALQDDDISGSVLVCAKEPSPGCTQLAIEARLSGIVFGDQHAARCADIIRQSGAPIDVVADVKANSTTEASS